MLLLEDLAGLAHEFASHLPAEVKEFEIGGRPFRFNTSPMVIGVVNLSPDSWYRESVCLSAEAAIQRARVITAQGADAVDIGAESTLAHAKRSDDTQQVASLLPVIRQLKSEGIVVSAETYSPVVARACLEHGASLLNITGPKRCEEMFELAAEHGAAVIICYVQGANVREVGDYELDGDPIERMRQYFLHMADIATVKGVEKVILDPGLGFYYRNMQDSAVRVRHQMRMFLNTFRLRSLGWPVCHALPHAFEQFGEEVRSAEGFFAVLAALGRTDVFRTHEVPKVRAVLKTLAAY